MTGIYRIADINIAVTSVYEKVHRMCADYLVCGQTADFSVETSEADIENERERSAREDALEGIPVRIFPDSYLETLAVYRRIAERMPDYDTVLFHGSCVSVDGTGYLFTARSGTGKSTHARLWRELLGERAVMVNDDKPLIRVGESSAVIYGTPWNGKHHLGSNISVPLKAVCILKRGESNRIEPLGADEAYPEMLQQAYRPMDRDAMRKTLSLLDRLSGSVRFWRLFCNTDIEAAGIAYEAMKGN